MQFEYINRNKCIHSPKILKTQSENYKTNLLIVCYKMITKCTDYKF